MNGRSGGLPRAFTSLLALGGSVWLSAPVAGPEWPASIVPHQYACTPGGMDLRTLQRCGVTLLSHMDWTPDVAEMRRYIAEAHARGIKLLPYVSPEKAWYLDTPERLKRFNRRNIGASIAYYSAVDPSEHPEWILIDKLGRPAPRYGSYVKTPAGACELKWGVWHAHGETYQDLENMNPWSWYRCSSAEGYIDAVERGVRALMDMGFDGVFVDNTYTSRLKPCHGVEFGKHKHRAPGHNTNKTYVELAQRIYKTVKSYGPDKIVLLNGGTQGVYKPIRDGSMIESYVAAPGARERRHKWATLLEWTRVYADEPEQGRVVTALSYMGATRYPDKDDCFYAYACALLSAFKWTADTPRMDIVRLLYRARLIAPQGGVENSDGLWFRRYDRGLVVVNPDQQRQVEAWLPLPTAVAVPVELYTGRRLPMKDTRALVRVGPESGRVIVDLSDTLDNYLVESATTLAEATQRLERATDEDLRRLRPLGEADWKRIGAQAGVLARNLDELLTNRPKEKGRGVQRKAMDLLAKIHHLDRLPAFSHDKIVCRLNQADDHVCQAVALASGVELSFAQDPPRLQPGQGATIELALTHHGDVACRVDDVRLRLPLGWNVAPPTHRVGRSVRPGERVKIAMTLQLPTDCKLPDKRLLVRARATCLGTDGRPIPCGANCFGRRIVSSESEKRPIGDEQRPTPKKSETRQTEDRKVK